MKHKQLKLSVLLLISIGVPDLYAQESVITSGGNISGNVSSISYSIGQIFYSIISGPVGSVSEGLQQPYEISELSVDEKPVVIDITVVPNPTKDFIIIRAGANIPLILTYTLITFKGQILENKNITDKETIIQMGYLPPSVYFLKISELNKDFKTFKIVKN